MNEKQLIKKHPDLLLKVLKLHPDLHMAAVVAAAAREHKCSEVTCHKDFANLAEPKKRNKVVICGDLIVSMAQAKKYFPSNFFPCQNEDDLIRKVIMAAANGRAQHEVERQLQSVPVAQARKKGGSKNARS